jgi:hypothetical protein
VALTNVVLPAATIAAACVVLRLLRKPLKERPTYLSWDAGRWERAFLLAASFAFAVILITPAVVALRRRINLSHINDVIYSRPRSSSVALYLTIAVAVIAFTVFMILYLWPKLMSPLHTVDKFHSLKALSFTFVLIAVLLIPPSIAVAGVTPLLESKACSSGGYANIGFFIGQTREALFFGEYRTRPEEGGGRRRILSMPLSQVEQLFLGRQAEDARCDKELDTQSFMQAINALGSDKLSVRISAIYALERIAETSVGEPYRQSIIRIVTSYIRERAPWPANCDVRSPRRLPDTYKPLEEVSDFLSRALPRLHTRAPDIDAAIDTLTGWDPDLRRDAGPIFLENLDLRKAFLDHANLQHTLLSGSHLEFADLRNAHLEEATLMRANLVGADLQDAHLEGTSFFETDLRGADLSGAHIDKRTVFEYATANADTKWPSGFDAKAAGVDFSDKPVLVCSYLPPPSSQSDATPKAVPARKAPSEDD